MIKNKKIIILAGTVLFACQAKQAEIPIIPSLEYSKNLRHQLQNDPNAHSREFIFNDQSSIRAHMHYVSNKNMDEEIVTNEQLAPTFEVHKSSMQYKRDYSGPLSLGDPGVTSSLWRESRGTNDIFRDQRAWQPMDLITIIISEKSEGTKEADTEIKSKSSVQAAIEQFFSFDDDVAESNPGRIIPGNLINASTQNDFKGEGGTTRKGSLRASISAMVAEVLPSGVLRIEGQKIISVNSEEQVMVISGLARPRDINSYNEIDSSKIANMRIDYYGKGIVGEAQVGGWLARILRVIWPF